MKQKRKPHPRYVIYAGRCKPPKITWTRVSELEEFPEEGFFFPFANRLMRYKLGMMIIAAYLNFRLWWRKV